MSESGHPKRFGFVQCAVCHTWQRAEATKRHRVTVEAPTGLYLSPPPEDVDICKDTAWCVARVRKEK